MKEETIALFSGFRMFLLKNWAGVEITIPVFVSVMIMPIGIFISRVYE
jgi:hypothetical protein